MKRIIAADIGGTNSRFGVFAADEKGTLHLSRSIWLKTQQASSFLNLLEQALAKGLPLSPAETDVAVFAVAGPVARRVSSAPPLIPWEIRIEVLRQAFGLEQSWLINDFVAQAYACLTPIMESAQELLPGEADHTAAKAVIGAGTGLGHAALLPDGLGGYIPSPSEGGHAPFPFESAAEIPYLEFLLREVGGPYVISNTVVSGRGLSLVHQFLTGEKLPPEQLLACAREDSETVQWMARFYGRACRNYALQILAQGGVYITGGVAAKLPCLVSHQEFVREFRSSRTMPGVLAKIPVFLNQNEESGLWGAATAALHDFTKV